MTAKNRLLAAMPVASLERIKPFLEPVELRADEVIYHPDLPIQVSYFLTQGLVALVKTMRNGRSVEIGAIGREGVTGPDVFFGIEDALLECVVRVPGTALRIRSDILRQEVARSPVTRSLMERFVLSIFNQIAQTAACNRLHSLEQRCCRWLLITDDDAGGGNTIPVTHETLATLLGVQRAGVSLKLQELERNGVIQRGRGYMSILDRKALEAAACECYGVIRTQLDHIFAESDNSRRSTANRRRRADV